MAIGGAIFLAVTVLLVFPQPEPPVSSLDEARRAIDRAAEAGALRYSNDVYRAAQKLLKEGWTEMGRQKGRLAPFRSYRVADSLLSLSARTAGQAATESERAKAHLDSLARSQNEELMNEILAWREAMEGTLMKLPAGSYLSSADLSLETSRMLIDEAEYEEALAAVSRGRLFLGRLSDMLADYLNDEAQKIDLWRGWVDEALRDSRRTGTYAVIVDKSAHKTHLVRKGELVRTYECELGYNSAQNKLFEGDGATPEGRYKVVSVKSRGSRYYKALLIDYPNQRDKMRFKANKSKGIVSPQARIGGFIEIHGEGGKGQDWTEGCVALSNADMDHLLRYVTMGTQVTIVRRSDKWP